MDTAVALVQAYLQVNGYFTVCEYPVVETTRRDSRAVTDLDILAVRFAGAGREVGTRRRRASGPASFEVDPALGGGEGADMIVGEVKEGRARLNPAARDPLVLAAALSRFGCCPPPHATSVVDDLLRRGRASTAHGHEVRMMVFGGRGDLGPRSSFTVVTLDHIVEFLRIYLEENWDVLHAAQIKVPALDLLALVHKSRMSQELP